MTAHVPVRAPEHVPAPEDVPEDVPKDLRAALGPWAATHRHRKGGLYREIARATWEADRTPAVIYDDADGAIWVRSAAEFDDGRFVDLAREAAALAEAQRRPKPLLARLARWWRG